MEYVTMSNIMGMKSNLLDGVSTTNDDLEKTSFKEDGRMIIIISR